MNWLWIARNDLRALGRSRLLWLATGFVALLSAVGAAIPAIVSDGGTPAYTVGVETLFIAIGTVIPFVALGLSYRSVVGERESGTMQFLLGFPNRRLDVVVGKALSRVAATATIATIGGVAGLAALFVLYDGVAPGGPILVVLGLVLVSAVYAAVGVAISAGTDSSTKAVGGAFGVYLLLFLLWNRIPQAIFWLVEGTTPDGATRPAWYALVTRLNPGTAIGDLTVARFEWMRDGAYVSNEPTAAMVAGDVPFYLSDPAAVVVVLVWLVVPLAIGYRRFRTQY